MRASVIICTRNRAASLRRVLETLTTIKDPGEAWELLIVDNGSTDDTRAVVAAYTSKLPVRLIFEPAAGLSLARNAGVAASRGEYIVWTDDDVAVDRSWLYEYVAAFKSYPTSVIFGGMTEPRFEEGGPTWIKKQVRHLIDMLAIRDFGQSPVAISAERMPYGLNYAVFREIQIKFPYDPELGVAPGRNKGGEETAVLNQILQAGGTGWWLPSAKIFHLIPLSRQTRRYIITYYKAQGESQADRAAADGSASLFGLPRWRIRRLADSLVKFVASSLLSDGRWVPHLVGVAFQFGWLKTYRSKRISKNSRPEIARLG